MRFLRYWALIALALITPFGHAQELSFDARLSQYSYPYPVHNFTFQSQRQTLQMSYMHLPAENSKPTAVLLHGKNFAADYWQKTAELLHARGYGVLMPDQIGFGKSSKPAHYQFSAEVLVNNTRALVRSLGLGQVMLVGHSMGGILASRYALNYPQEVTTLVLVNPIGLEDYLKYVEYRDLDFFYQNELEKTAADIIHYQKKNYYDGKWQPAYEALTRIHQGWINGPDWPLVAWNNAQTYDVIFTGAVINEFAQLAMPVHLIIGTRDRTGPGRGWKKPGVEYSLGQYDQLGKKAARLIPEAYLHELEGVGHMPQFEAFDRYREIMLDIFQ